MRKSKSQLSRWRWVWLAAISLIFVATTIYVRDLLESQSFERERSIHIQIQKLIEEQDLYEHREDKFREVDVVALRRVLKELSPEDNPYLVELLHKHKIYLFDTPYSCHEIVVMSYKVSSRRGRQYILGISATGSLVYLQEPFDCDRPSEEHLVEF